MTVVAVVVEGKRLNREQRGKGKGVWGKETLNIEGMVEEARERGREKDARYGGGG